MSILSNSPVALLSIAGSYVCSLPHTHPGTSLERVRVVNQQAFKCSAKEEHWNKVCVWLAVNLVWGLGSSVSNR